MNRPTCLLGPIAIDYTGYEAMLETSPNFFRWFKDQDNKNNDLI